MTVRPCQPEPPSRDRSRDPLATVSPTFESVVLCEMYRAGMSHIGTSRPLRNVRLESARRSKADISPRLISDV
jgi:hypothetical protein